MDGLVTDNDLRWCRVLRVTARGLDRDGQEATPRIHANLLLIAPEREASRVRIVIGSGPLLHIPRLVPHNLVMDSVDHPLDWWAYGGYPAVMRELICDKTVARHKVLAKLKEHFERTGDPIWKPVGNHGHAQLRRAITAGAVIDGELV